MKNGNKKKAVSYPAALVNQWNTDSNNIMQKASQINIKLAFLFHCV